MLQMLNHPDRPAPMGYSHAVAAANPGRFVFISGQVGTLPDGSIAEGMAAQAVAAIGNLNAMLKEAGMSTSDIAKLTIYLTDESLMGEFMQAGGPLLPSPPPAVTLLFVKALASPEMLIEIEAVAAA